MKVVIAIDSFKGSLSSSQLGNSVEKGIRKVYSEAEIKKIPIADGGEGTVESLVDGTNGKYISVSVNNPLMRKIEATYGIIENNIAVIEMASASGLTLLKVEERNPLKTSSYGTGELIKDAVLKGCREFIIGIGGSATNDGGTGMLQALGFRFFDKENNELGYGGEILSKIAYIDDIAAIKELKDCKFLIACDVDNPFYGPNGAAYVYGKQKGADDEMIKTLDEGLKKFSEVTYEKTNIDISEIPGAGAAGGLGGGFLAFLNGILKPGIDIVLEKVNFEEEIQDADFIITGEGKIDFQSVMGKAPVGVSKLGKKHNIPVIALAGCIADDADETHKFGISAMFSTINYPLSLDEAMEQERAKIFVEKNTEEIFRLIKTCQIKYQ